MKKILVLAVTVAFLAAGCGGDKKDEAKMSPDPAKQEGRSSGPSGRAQEPEPAKAEAKPEEKPEAKAEAKAEEKVEEKVETETGDAETGEALWTKSCEYATKLIAASPEMKDMPEEARAGVIKGLPKQCMAEMMRVSPAAADESAKCMLALKVFTNDGFAKCEPKEAAPAPAPEVKAVDETGGGEGEAK